MPNSLVVVNENGQPSSATIQGNTISAERWQLVGELAANGSKLFWTNQMIWERSPPYSGVITQADGARLFGTWRYNGGNCSIRFEGKQLTVINENGAPAVAGFQRILEVPLWNITGEISKDWKQIRWSNGTVWTR